MVKRKPPAQQFSDEERATVAELRQPDGSYRGTGENPPRTPINNNTARVVEILTADPAAWIVEQQDATDEFNNTRFVLHWWGHRLDTNADGLRSQHYHANMDRFLVDNSRTVHHILPAAGAE